MLPALDLETVTGLWLALSARFGTRNVRKATSLRMQAVAWFLATLRILPRRTFLVDFTTTIGRTIYLPFDPGTPADDAECWRRLCLCVHEHQHVAQWRRGPARFVLGYLLSQRRRAELEAEAFGTALELAAWAGRPLPDPAQLAGRLQYYGVRQRHVEHAARLLKTVAQRAQGGDVHSEAGRAAIDWLAGHVGGDTQSPAPSILAAAPMVR